MGAVENSVFLNSPGLMLAVVIFLFVSLVVFMGIDIYNAIREYMAERDGYELPEDDWVDTIIKFMIKLCFLIVITVILLVVFILPVIDMVKF